MRTQVRLGVFETNSSSTHSITIVTQEEWDAWAEGKLVYLRYQGLIDVEEADACALTMEEWENQEDLETFVESRKVGNVDIIAFGEYGHV